jgi:hypothetical protein
MLTDWRSSELGTFDQTQNTTACLPTVLHAVRKVTIVRRNRTVIQLVLFLSPSPLCPTLRFPVCPRSYPKLRRRSRFVALCVCVPEARFLCLLHPLSNEPRLVMNVGQKLPDASPSHHIKVKYSSSQEFCSIPNVFTFKGRRATQLLHLFYVTRWPWSARALSS